MFPISGGGGAKKRASCASAAPVWSRVLDGGLQRDISSFIELSASGHTKSGDYDFLGPWLPARPDTVASGEVSLSPLFPLRIQRPSQDNRFRRKCSRDTHIE